MPKSFTLRPSVPHPYQPSTGSRWRADDLDLLRHFVEGRTSARAVARRLGRTVGAVYRMASRLRESIAGADFDDVPVASDGRREDPHVE